MIQSASEATNNMKSPKANRKGLFKIFELVGLSISLFVSVFIFVFPSTSQVMVANFHANVLIAPPILESININRDTLSKLGFSEYGLKTSILTVAMYYIVILYSIFFLFVQIKFRINLINVRKVYSKIIYYSLFFIIGIMFIYVVFFSGNSYLMNHGDFFGILNPPFGYFVIAMAPLGISHFITALPVYLILRN